MVEPVAGQHPGSRVQYVVGAVQINQVHIERAGTAPGDESAVADVDPQVRANGIRRALGVPVPFDQRLKSLKIGGVDPPFDGQSRTNAHVETGRRLSHEIISQASAAGEVHRLGDLPGNESERTHQVAVIGTNGVHEIALERPHGNQPRRRSQAFARRARWGGGRLAPGIAKEEVNLGVSQSAVVYLHVVNQTVEVGRGNQT